QAPVTENSTPIETVTATTTFNISTSTETTSTTTKPILATTTVKEDIVAKPTTVETPTETPKVTYTITPETLTTITKQDLKSGQQTPEVELLQQFLNANGFIISQTGPGSPGHETTYFGKATKSALAKYQKSVGLPATGYFGPMTRAKILNN
ncbi:MAG: peptidoglycan-binding domain-containing protein, partial [bacterium]